MIKKILGILTTLGVVALVVVTALHMGNYHSMIWTGKTNEQPQHVEPSVVVEDSIAVQHSALETDSLSIGETPNVESSESASSVN